MTRAVSPPQSARVEVRSDSDIVAARMCGRRLALDLGFPTATATLIATAISELARNIILYARTGEIVLAPAERNGRVGVSVVARDEGPGIPDLAQAMADGYSTSGRLGLGLPGVRRLVDHFEITSRAGEGTSVRVTVWKM